MSTLAGRRETFFLSLDLYIYLYIQVKNPRRARARAETRTYGTDSPSRSKSRALSHHATAQSSKKDGSMTDFQYTQSDPHGSHRKMFISTVFELLGGRSSQPSDWLPFREWGKMSERTLEGGASRVRVISSADSRVDRFVCAGSPSSSRLFF